MRTIIFTNARDENNILEWAIHHKNIGFNHVYIFDHISIIPISNVLDGLEDVTVHYVKEDFVPKTKLMLTAAIIAKNNNYDWMFYLDADEFLALPLFPNVESFINNYPNNSQISVNWVMYGTNYLNEEPKTTILESYTRYEGLIDRHVKSFVRPHLVLDVVNPHYYIIDNKYFSSGIILNKCDPNEKAFYPIDPNTPIDVMPAFIAHYVYQAYSVYLKRKRDRNRDDINLPHNITDENSLNNQYNNCETTFIRDLYNNNNKIKIEEFLNSRK